MGTPDVEALESLASTLRFVSGRVDDSIVSIRRRVAELIDGGAWTGAVATAFESVWSADSGQLSLLRNELGEIADVLDTLAGQAGGIERELGYLANELTAQPDHLDGEVNALRTRLIAYEDIARSRLQGVLGSLEAARATRAQANANPALMADLETSEQFGDYGAINADLAKLTPQQIKIFISGLSPVEAAALAGGDSRFIGNLDGVPLGLRGDANHLSAEADLLTARRNGDQSEIKVLETLLDGQPPPGTPAGTLVLYDLARGHFGVMYGSPDASHIAMLIPGVDVDHDLPKDLRGMTTDGYNIQRTAGPDSAVIVWKGYDNPGDSGYLDVANAALNGRAEVGAKSLSSFSAGLGLSGSQTLTVIGHSYGSVVTGEALANYGLQPTNVVIAGSPGLTVDSVQGLHLQPNQFFDEKAPGDYVANLAGGFGVDPSQPGFGGARLATNGSGMPSVSGHTSYWTAGSQSVKGVADVINGSVPAADVQRPGAGDYVKRPVGAAVLAYGDPGAPLIHYLDQHYNGPGSGLVQLDDHVVTGLANQAGSVASFAVDTASGVAGDVWDVLTSW